MFNGANSGWKKPTCKDKERTVKYWDLVLLNYDNQ